ncbi:hypothetical protein COV19_03315 [Candidatus Woesearchaeota archaeon CG10_big_fil_rev_8_21_14_0_10_44_13]|nr:MAG: hypothetical protein COV19_03315 [Candidatus Woesearchaeota archaeon CG10_big_fil_rev_8_21_14_0_10_44_13]
MGFLDLIKGNTEFEIRGKRILIVGQAEKEVIDLIKQAFEAIAQKSTILNYFTDLEIVLETKSINESDLLLSKPDSSLIAEVRSSDVRLGKDRIHFSSDVLKALVAENAAKQGDIGLRKLTNGLYHELTHLLQYKIGRLKQMKDANYRIRGKFLTTSSFASFISFFNSDYDIKDLRSHLMNFMQAIMAEGLADYSEEMIRGTDINEEFFRDHHRSAEISAQDIKSKWERVLEQHKKKSKSSFDNEVLKSYHSALLRAFEDKRYAMGLHMVDSILQYDKKMSLEKLIRMGYLKFIKIYENSMGRMRLQPVVSVNSGRGILDYDRMLKQGADALKKSRWKWF